MLSRRQFCQYLAATVAGAAIIDLNGLRAFAAETDNFSVTQLGPGLWVFSGGGGNVLLAQNGQHPVQIDAGVGSIAPELLSKTTSRIGTRSCTLLNTHHHGDHIGGNNVIRNGFDTEVTVVGQEKLTPRVAATLDQSIRPGLLRAAEDADNKDELIAQAEALTAADFAPTQTFTDELELKIGDTTFLMQHYGAGHTDNDAVVFLPQQNILHMGDLVFNDLHPYVIAEHGANVAGWQKSLTQALKLCDAETVVIPGHGAVDDRSALVRMDEYFQQVTEIVAAAIAEGRTREEVAALKPEVFADRGLANVQHMTLGQVYDELSGS